MLHKKAAYERFRNSGFSFFRADNGEIILKKQLVVNKKVCIVYFGLPDMLFREEMMQRNVARKGCAYCTKGAGNLFGVIRQAVSRRNDATGRCQIWLILLAKWDAG